MERQIIACIPIPGLNEWAKEIANANQNVEVYVILFNTFYKIINIILLLNYIILI